MIDKKKYTSNELRADPHPLDYDWRFTNLTSEKLALLAPKESRILLLGTPSICSYLSTKSNINSEVLVVDRQPLNGFFRQLITDIGTAAPINELFDFALIDPPWYPQEAKRWISWASQSIAENGRIVASLWPKSTRPTAIFEREELFTWLRGWSDFSVKEDTLEYEVPHFEDVAKQVSLNFSNEKTWIKGDLLYIAPFDKPKLIPPITRQNEWIRYTIGKLQLAVKLDSVAKVPPTLNYVSNNSWVWPHVSKRAQGRSEIGFWSSDNFAASLSGSEAFIDLLETYLGLKHQVSIDIKNSTMQWFWKIFHSWNIPESTPELVKKWKHRD